MDNRPSITVKITSVVLAFLGILIIIALFWAYEPVEAGTVKVITRFGRVTGRVLEPGLNWITPFVENTLKYNTKKVTYELAQEDKQKESKATYKDFPIDTTTKDGQQVVINFTIRFSVDSTKAGWIAQYIGSENDVVEKIVKTEARIHGRNLAREFNAADLYTGNVQEYQVKVTEVISPIFTENGLILDEFGVREVVFSKEYIATVEQKQIEKEKVITAENIAKRAEEEKKAAITKAEGEARAQELQRATLSDVVLDKLRLENERARIEKWNGAYPQYLLMPGGSEGFLFNLPFAQ